MIDNTNLNVTNVTADNVILDETPDDRSVYYYGHQRNCTCINNCRNVTITCGQLGEWEYDTNECSGEFTLS
jgi:hypothetical protein